MEGPSYSLFHGGENIRVNTSDLDDEEALERHKSVIQNYFLCHNFR